MLMVAEDHLLQVTVVVAMVEVVVVVVVVAAGRGKRCLATRLDIPGEPSVVSLPPYYSWLL